MSSNDRQQKTSFVETSQSLVVAFVLAMVFRGFVVEGFVIPTGSMAPTLFGQHVLKHSDQTGRDFAVGIGARQTISPDRYTDPDLGRSIPLGTANAKVNIPRAGDRVLVLKTLYPFFEPERFDVVVFKNPTDTQGASANYIKRLIGLPGETIWIADGDIFAKDGDPEFKIQRKSEHVQRALWRPVSNSDAIPTDAFALTLLWRGPPWGGRSENVWTFQNRVWSCNTSEPSVLAWNNNRMPIDDWLPYNMLMNAVPHVPVSDIRVSATILPETSGLEVGFTLTAIGHRFNWSLTGETLSLSMTPLGGGESVDVTATTDSLVAGEAVRIECWHVDQAMAMYINGQRVAELLYDFGPEQRLRLATGVGPFATIQEIADKSGSPPKLMWNFEGSPLTLTLLQVDHDLYYRSSILPSRATKNPTEPGNEKLVELYSPSYGTYPKLAELNQDQFLMAGDNSAYSLDGRLWGNPDEFVAAQIDKAPFVVHRDLLIGKAWSVYWPATHRLGPLPIVPNFGRVRFIR